MKLGISFVALFLVAAVDAQNVCNDRVQISDWESLSEPIYQLISSEEYVNTLLEQLQAGTSTAVYSSAGFNQIYGNLLTQTVPGTGATVQQVLDGLTGIHAGCSVYLIGGVVRDVILTSKTGAPLSVKDFDIQMQCGETWNKTVFCNEVYEFCETNYGQGVCSKCNFSLSIGFITIGNEDERGTVDTHHWSEIINNEPVRSWEFSVTTMVYEHVYKYIIDLSGLGMGDICQDPPFFQIPVKNSLWNQWLGFQSQGELRYWKLRIKTFVTDEPTEKFLVSKSYDLINSDEEEDRVDFGDFYCLELLVADGFDDITITCLADDQDRLNELTAVKQTVDAIFQHDIDEVEGGGTWDRLVEDGKIPGIIIEGNVKNKQVQHLISLVLLFCCTLATVQ